MSITFELWVEEFNGAMTQFGRFENYEEAQDAGMNAINRYRSIRNWHVTVQGQKPIPSHEPIPYALERWHEFHEKTPV
jgi:hypothetical protein